MTNSFPTSLTSDKMKFGPTPINVRVGDVILWVNKDIFGHTAKARDRSFNIDLAPAHSGKTVIKRSGVLPFFCMFHPGMQGQLTEIGRASSRENVRQYG